MPWKISLNFSPRLIQDFPPFIPFDYLEIWITAPYSSILSKELSSGSILYNFYLHSMVRMMVSLSLFFIVQGCAPQAPIISYPSHPDPRDTPLIFAPGFISLPDRWEGNLSFAGDGKTLYFNIFTDHGKNIVQSDWNGKTWSTPAPIKALGDQPNWEPHLSHGDQQLYFISSRPPGSPEWDGRIWRSNRKEGQWQKPTLVELEVGSESGFWFPTLSKSGELYFGANIPSVRALGAGDLYCLSRSGNIQHLVGVNTEYEEWDPFIAPDGRYLLWASDRPGGYGGTDLYIAFRSDQSVWSEAINLGNKINTSQYEVAPRISPDEKYLFFDRPRQGTQDIFWVSAESILNKAN